MLWVALHFYALPLEIYSRGIDCSEPLAITEKRGRRNTVLICNAAAGAGGVKPGMSAAAAEAIANGLAMCPRNLAEEIESLSGIAAWAGRFTPSICLQPPDGVLLEISSCLRLHHGFNNLMQQLHDGLDSLGYARNWATAATPHAAWLLALAGTGERRHDAGQLENVLGELSVNLLAQPPETIQGLEMIGAHILADCLRLPRAGLARRFGKTLLDELDRAFGKQPDPREFFVPPDRFERRIELPALVHESERLVFAVFRLLPELEGYLSLRQAGVQAFELVCSHEDMPATVVQLGFAQPTRSLARMQLLMRETLAATQLPAPVHTIALVAGNILPLETPTTDLFQDKTAGDADLLLERMRIRLGKAAVSGITPTADHRPELAWKYCAAQEAIHTPDHPQRPLWLLPEPLSCPLERLVLQSGPERIESGWWDGRDVARDYYVAQHRNGSRLWVYREHASGTWYVHGLFA